ncbi:hypothetical protein NXS98_12510 [Fontisphaera persica]|uniref:hypothetical protein n=1 Tax=Fontisphaera persica TaxID=2974023 RepID=UPI0024C05966|nr:hypothetical protein [Fontisphaera persica]WCJ58539.1 hypothetical protein NXS98_12510 [Fontisphaera persica]
MAYLDLLLNLIAWLLWASWRTARLAAAPAPLTLASTVRPADQNQRRRWRYLALLMGLLLLRGLFYWQLGGPLDWTPKISLGLLVVSFKCETVGRYLLFSLVSFLHFFVVVYFGLLLLSALQGRPVEISPPVRFIRHLVGRPARWPAGVQALLPFLLAIAGWPLLQFFLQALGYLPAVSWAEAWQQALGFGVVVLLAWKYLLLGLFFLHLVNLYVYLGPGSFWPFVSHSARVLLRPLRWLRLGKLDVSPIAGMALVLAVCWPIERWPEWWKVAPAPPPAPTRPARPPA